MSYVTISLFQCNAMWWTDDAKEKALVTIALICID